MDSKNLDVIQTNESISIHFNLFSFAKIIIKGFNFIIHKRKFEALKNAHLFKKNITNILFVILNMNTLHKSICIYINTINIL